MEVIKKLFRPSEKYQGIWPINIYVLKFFFLLMFLLAAKDAWTELLTHEGDWNPEVALAWCAITAYTTLSGIGIFRTVKMLPIMLFMIFYKSLWLIFVAYPLWQNGTLAGTEAEEWLHAFIPVVLPIIFMPWKYVFKSYILGRDYS